MLKKRKIRFFLFIFYTYNIFMVSNSISQEDTRTYYIKLYR